MLRTPHRNGLLAALLALVTVSSGAVALSAGGTGAVRGGAPPATGGTASATVVASVDAGDHEDDHAHRHGR